MSKIPRLKKPMLVLCGPSGSGKNFIPELFGLTYTPGNTTRQPRSTDPQLTYHDKNWVEINLEEVKTYSPYLTSYQGNWYWTTFNDFNNQANHFTVVDFFGVQKLWEQKNKLKRSLKFIYFECSFIRRIQNMRKRGDGWKKIFLRIWNDRNLFKGAKQYILNVCQGEVIKI